MVLPSNISDTPTQAAPPPPRRPRVRPGLSTLLLSLLGLILVVAGFVYFGLSGNRPGASPAPGPRTTSTPAVAGAPPVPSGPTATPAEATAIQQVIQRGDQAQIQALASKDPSPMRDDATAQYYDQMTSTNQDLLDSGVSSIQLVRIDWGTIVVNGNSAIVTCYETWSTTFADGSVDQSRDLNVYTLVQQNGSWKVQSDDHPDAGSGQ